MPARSIGLALLSSGWLQHRGVSHGSEGVWVHQNWRGRKTPNSRNDIFHTGFSSICDSTTNTWKHWGRVVRTSEHLAQGHPGNDLKMSLKRDLTQKHSDSQPSPLKLLPKLLLTKRIYVAIFDFPKISRMKLQCRTDPGPNLFARPTGKMLPGSEERCEKVTSHQLSRKGFEV